MTLLSRNMAQVQVFILQIRFPSLNLPGQVSLKCFEYVWNMPAFDTLCRSIELDKVDGQSPLTVALRYRLGLTPKVKKLVRLGLNFKTLMTGGLYFKTLMTLRMPEEDKAGFGLKS